MKKEKREREEQRVFQGSAGENFRERELILGGRKKGRIKKMDRQHERKRKISHREGRVYRWGKRKKKPRRLWLR